MNRGMIGLALGGLLLGAAFGALALRPTDNPDNGRAASVSGKPLVGGPFSLIDQTGKRVTDQDFRGKEMLVFFGFTNCPDICPAGLQVMSAALQKLGKKGDDVVPLFITLDPESPFSKFTALPIQIYQWTTRAQSEFHSIAAAAIIVLLVLLLTLNATAILLRNRFQKRW